jgi:ankyrin repeat protein
MSTRIPILLLLGLALAAGGYYTREHYHALQERQDQLVAAVIRGDRCRAAELIDQGADVNGKDSYGRRPLQAAAMCHDDDMVRFLVRCGAEERLEDEAPHGS